MAHEIDTPFINPVLPAHILHDLHDVVFAGLLRPTCHRIGRRISHAPAVSAIDAISERSGDNIAVSFRKTDERTIVPIEEGILGTSKTMQRDDQWKRTGPVVV